MENYNGVCELALKEQALRFNNEKVAWMMGIIVWLMCFMAILVMNIWFAVFSYVGIVISIIVLIILGIARGKVRKSVGNMIKDIEELKDAKK